jgi:hypothetical protein
MTNFPALKLKTLVNFPANAFGGLGIEIDKSNGSYTVNLDYEQFLPPIIALPPDTTTLYALIWNSATDVYELCPLSLSAGTAPSNAIPLMDGVGNAGASIFFSRGDHVHPTDVSRAPVNNPQFTGDPQVPTAAPGDNDNSAASTAFVTAAITAQAGITRVWSSAGTLVIAANDRVVAVNKASGSPTPVTLPQASTKNGSVLVADFKRDAGTNNITLTPFGGELIMGLASYTIAANGGSLELRPVSGLGWVA